MKTRIVIFLVAVAFVTGMMVQAIPADAAQKECKKDENSSCWIRVSQLFETTLNKLEAVNKHFESPATDNTPPPDEIKRELKALLEDMDKEISEIQHKQTDWDFLLR
ncbi:MAG: hypothetical protein ACE5RN_07235 [Nitrosopumilaceae archaeon]